jgi:hypothetical protein
MPEPTRANVDCRLVGEYVDEAETPPVVGERSAPLPLGEAVKTNVVATYCDVWSPHEEAREFTVLLRDKREITVRGHAVRYLPGNPASSDAGSYGVVVRGGEGEVFVALFQAGDVIGIFNGNMRPARESA